MHEITYGYLVENRGMCHVFEDEDDMERFVETFDVEVERDYQRPRRCIIHHFDPLACKFMKGGEVPHETR